jgi:hypothetical protein
LNADQLIEVFVSRGAVGRSTAIEGIVDVVEGEEEILAALTEHRIGAIVTGEGVVAGAAFEIVVAGAAENFVVAAPSKQSISAAISREHVFSAVAGEDVVVLVSDHVAVAAAAKRLLDDCRDLIAFFDFTAY